MSWVKIEKKEDKDPKWAHVDIPEDKNEICKLCNEIDDAYEKYKDRKLYFGNFYNMSGDRKVAEYLYSVSEIQKCAGELSSMSVDIFMNDSVDSRQLEKIMGRMLFYMEVCMMSHGKDLTDAADECGKICEAVKRV